MHLELPYELSLKVDVVGGNRGCVGQLRSATEDSQRSRPRRHAVYSDLVVDVGISRQRGKIASGIERNPSAESMD